MDYVGFYLTDYDSDWSPPYQAKETRKGDRRLVP